MTDLDISLMAESLEAMKGPNDGKGAYLGDGIPRKNSVPLRSIEIAQLLRELLEYCKDKQ